MECRRFSQTIASEWQTAFVVSHKMPWCALLTAVKNDNKSLEKLQDFFFHAETKTKTKCSRPRPSLQDFMIQDQDQDQDQDFHFCPRGASRPRPWSRGLHHCSSNSTLSVVVVVTGFMRARMLLLTLT